MDLAQAKKYATACVDWLSPFCSRIFVAGSIRRESPNPSDIDLVVIPKRAESRDLFEVRVGENLLHPALVRHVAGSGGRSKWVVGEKHPEAKQFILQLYKCQVDIYVANADNWGSVFLARTGSKEANIWFANRAEKLGLKWEISVGLKHDYQIVAALSEYAIFAALNLPFIEPQNRHLDFLETLT